MNNRRLRTIISCENAGFGTELFSRRRPWRSDP